MTLKLRILRSLTWLFIILVSLMRSLFCEKMLISNRCISGLMSNLIKKSWTVSNLHAYLKWEITGIAGIHAIPIIFMCILKGIICDTGIMGKTFVVQFSDHRSSAILSPPPKQYVEFKFRKGFLSTTVHALSMDRF